MYSPRICQIIILITSAFAILAARADGNESWVPLGARPIALGGAFVAPPPDWIDLRWNPASIAFINHYHIQTDYVDLYRDGNHYYNLSYISPSGIRSLNFGICWAHFSVFDGIVDYEEHEYNFVLAHRFFKRLKTAVNLKIIRTMFGQPAASDKSGMGYGLNLGLILRITPSISLGLRINDFGDTYIRYDNRISYKLYDRGTSFGARFLFRPKWQSFFSITPNAVHTGLEFIYHPKLILRTGFQKDINYWSEYALSAGIGLKYRQFQFDYAYRYHEILPDNHYLSLSLNLEKKKLPIQIMSIQLRDIFPVLYKNYSIEPIGYIQVKNQSPEVCRVGAVAMLPPYTIESNEISEWFDCKPNEIRTIPLYLYGLDAILTVQEDRPVSITIKSSSYCEEERITTANGETILHQRNAITWEDPQKIAAFIYPISEVIDKFIRETLRNFDESIPPYVPVQLAQTIQIYDELSELEFQYKPDPNHPYETTVLRPDEIDTVQNPSETLLKRTGDCDDLVVLYSACLENIGIHTAIVDFPGHLFLLFRTDEAVLPEISLLYGVEWQNETWYPVEMTLIGSSWVEANTVGKQLYNAWKDRNDIFIFTVADAWRKYPSVEFPTSVNVLTVTPEANLLQIDYGVVRTQLKQMIKQNFEPDRDVDSVSVLGMRYAQAGLFDEAADLFLLNLIQNETSISYNNNLGNVYALMGKYRQALFYFEKALLLDTEDAEIHYNKALMLYQLNRWDEASEAYEKAYRINPKLPVNQFLKTLEK